MINSKNKLKLIPSLKQFLSWSMPNKVTYIAGWLAIFSLIFGLFTFFYSPNNYKILKVIESQNERINQQIHYQEANKKGSLVLLVSNVLDKIDEELQEEGNKKDTLSKSLIGRIVSLSQSLKPYHYLDGDTLITSPLSPERGQLLIALSKSNISHESLTKIYRDADFSYATIDKIDLQYSFLVGVNLDYANLKSINLSFSNLVDASFEGANLENSKLIGIDWRGTNFQKSNLVNANISSGKIKDDILRSLFGSPNFPKTKQQMVPELFDKSIMIRGIFSPRFKGANLTNAALVERDLKMIDFSNAILEKTNFYGCVVGATTFRNPVNLKAKQLTKLKKISGSLELPLDIYLDLRALKPCLFTQEGCEYPKNINALEEVYDHLK